MADDAKLEWNTFSTKDPEIRREKLRAIIDPVHHILLEMGHKGSVEFWVESSGLVDPAEMSAAACPG